MPTYARRQRPTSEPTPGVPDDGRQIILFELGEHHVRLAVAGRIGVSPLRDDDREGGGRQARKQLREELTGRLVGPVGVLENDERRLGIGAEQVDRQASGELAPLGVHPDPGRVGDAEKRREQAGQGARVRPDRRNPVGELVGAGDAAAQPPPQQLGEGAQRLPEPERLEDAVDRLDATNPSPADDLADESGLARAGRSGQPERAARAGDSPGQQGISCGELCGSTHDRGVAGTVEAPLRGGQPEHLGHGDGIGLPLDRDLPPAAEAHGLGECFRRRAVHERVAVPGGGHQPGGQVGGIAEPGQEAPRRAAERRREDEAGGHAGSEARSGRPHSLDEMHGADRVVRMRDRNAEHGVEHHALVAAGALQQIATRLADQIGGCPREFGEAGERVRVAIIERREREEGGRQPAVLVGDRPSRKQSRGRDRVKHTPGPSREPTQLESIDLGLGNGRIDHDASWSGLLLGDHRRVQPRTDVGQDVAIAGRTHERRHPAGGDADANGNVQRAVHRRHPPGLVDQPDHVLGRPQRTFRGRRSGERRGDRIATEGNGVAALQRDRLDGAADHPANDRAELLGAGRSVAGEPLGERREPGEVDEDGDGVLREPAVTRRERGMARGARQEWLQSFHRRLVAAR